MSGSIRIRKRAEQIQPAKQREQVISELLLLRMPEPEGNSRKRARENPEGPGMKSGIREQKIRLPGFRIYREPAAARRERGSAGDMWIWIFPLRSSVSEEIAISIRSIPQTGRRIPGIFSGRGGSRRPDLMWRN